MNVIIDARMVDEHLHGIARYTYEIIKGVSKENDINIKLLINNREISNKIFGEFNNIEYIIMKSKFLSIGEQIELPWIINKYKKDTIFHSPSFVSSPLIKIPMVMTIHDLNHLEFPQYYSPFHKYYYKYIVKTSALKCKKILTDSKFSKGEILKWLKFDESNVKVTYCGVGEKFRIIKDEIELERVQKKYKLPNKFVLYVGNLRPHKNVESLVEAMKSIDNIRLVINGKANESLKQIIDKYTLKERIQFIGYIDEEDLPVIYNLATVFVFPSLYEGFGLPPLEAMACGCPVVTSNVSSLPEVVGSLAITVDPKDKEKIANSIQLLLSNKVMRENMSIEASQYSKRFTWGKTVQETINVYKKINTK